MLVLFLVLVSRGKPNKYTLYLEKKMGLFQAIPRSCKSLNYCLKIATEEPLAAKKTSVSPAMNRCTVHECRDVDKALHLSPDH